MYVKMDKAPARIVLILAALLLVSTGIDYRVLASRLSLVTNGTISLPIPMSSFPTEIGNVVGDELTIPNVTRQHTESYFTNDFLNRRYTNPVDGILK